MIIKTIASPLAYSYTERDKKMRKTAYLMVFVMAIGLSVLSMDTANATSILFEYDNQYYGDAILPEDTTFLTAVFDDDTGDPNTVRLTMSVIDVPDGDSATAWYFNIDPTLDLTLLSFDPVDNSDSTPQNILTGFDAFTTVSGVSGNFDMLFEFPTRNNKGGIYKFTIDESVTYDIIYTSPIDVNAFNVENESGFKTAAIITGSLAEVDLPEPATVLFLGVALLGLGALRRKFR